MARAILHVDMDAFFASVEQRDDPALRDRPVAVASASARAVVLAASYESRRHGVRSAIPIGQALRLCPGLLVVPPRFEVYAAVSERVFALCESLTPLVEPLSLDEAFLDVTASQSLRGSPAEMARALRERIAVELGLPASAGIAPVKFVAKIASDLAKPNGQREVRPADVAAFLAPLPVARLPGVGPVAEAALARVGLRTLGEIAAKEPAWLLSRLGAQGARLRELSLGEDDRPVIPDRQRQSLGAEDTFERDLPPTAEALGGALHSQALRVGARLRRAGLRARVIVLKLKRADFQLATRRRTLREATDDGQAIYREALELLAATPAKGPIRLTGISGTELVRPGAEGQLGLFSATAQPPRAETLNAALDRIASRFGPKAVTTADLLPSATDVRRVHDANR